jgi:replicative DNA helicase
MSAIPDWHNESRVESLRIPPHAVDAEQSVLGALMLVNGHLPKVSDWLTPEDFYRRDHQEIYRAILDVAPEPFDALTLGDWFEANGNAELVQFGAYLGEIASSTGSAANIVAYAEIVKEKSQRRQSIEIGMDLTNRAFDPGGMDVHEIAADAGRRLQEIRGSDRMGGLVTASSTLTDFYNDLIDRHQKGGGVTGLAYPWAEVNAATYGLQPGELTIIAARPSMGKSIMGLNMALFAALAGRNTALFSLEMTARQVNRRNISCLGRVPYPWLLSPTTEGERDTDYTPYVADAIRQLKPASLLIDESAGLSIDKIIARARRAHMQKPIELLVLDHMHEVKVPGKKEPRFEIGDIADAGKMLAKEFNCPAVWLAQLNRSLENRADKRPQMSDLRETGEIEQKADVIWFVYREDYYQRNNRDWRKRHDVELIMGKGRDLEVGAPIILREDFGFMTLSDWDRDRYGDPPARFQPQGGSKSSGFS